jgi:hypothetical protein
MDHNAHVIRVVKKRGGMLVDGIVEFPLGGSRLPDELVKIVAILVVAVLTMMSRAIAPCWPFRKVSEERNFVVP